MQGIRSGTGRGRIPAADHDDSLQRFGKRLDGIRQLRAEKTGE